MTYRISGLDPRPFAPLFLLPEEDLAARSIVRMPVTSRLGFPCRISLNDAEPGGMVLLLNHVSIADGPYAATHAIFVSEGAEQGRFEDAVPPALQRRMLSLRAFDGENMMVDAALASPGDADGAIRQLFENQVVQYIYAHNATRGCFAATVEPS
jgi:hypothetical protein